MKKIIYIIIFGILGIVAYYSFQSAKADIYGSSLVGWWRFDTNSDIDGVTKDDSGSGNNGNLVNIATSTFYSIGKLSQGFNFDGTNDYVSTSDIFYSDAFTVCAWFKVTALHATEIKVIAAKRNSSGATSGTYEWEFKVNSAAKLGFTSQNASAGNALSNSGATTINLNQWYHGCNVQNGNGNTGYLYLNGVEDDSSAQATAMRDSASLIQFGVRTNGNSNRYWNGIIDDVRIYDRALSAGDVAQLYNMGLKISAFGDF